MKVRYCETPLQGLMPCQTGWGNASAEGVQTCQDEPMEKNCHYIVDTNELYCPYCNSKIEMPKEEHLFGDNIRGVTKAFKR